MFVCQNQPCGAQWSPDEVEIRNEGQGPLFRCPLCGARNPLEARPGPDGAPRYRQVSHAPAPSAPARRPGPPPPRGRKRH
ncbi:hypothetical protein EHF44_15620 [Cupriavidus pauculus]|uniref:Uncharacterized protein n=1 Tax=Cupriavidus pauculus TaxID=82633 RepID=A0A3G8H4D8_9BURK|nr:hypothetical protein [Cupriavidus pauculus]AZG15401.1 hypothetical protein EHF44_15620 [Cupriavidus pauculus]